MRKTKRFGNLVLTAGEDGKWLYVEDLDGNVLQELDCELMPDLPDTVRRAVEWALQDNDYIVAEKEPDGDEVAEKIYHYNLTRGT